MLAFPGALGVQDQGQPIQAVKINIIAGLLQYLDHIQAMNQTSSELALRRLSVSKSSSEACLSLITCN
jgi:hypothetical protein